MGEARLQSSFQRQLGVNLAHHVPEPGLGLEGGHGQPLRIQGSHERLLLLEDGPGLFEPASMLFLEGPGRLLYLIAMRLPTGKLPRILLSSPTTGAVHADHSTRRGSEITLASDPGTYVLIMKAPDEGSATIGKLGRIDFEGGWLLYVGSAFGSGGLRARVRRHLRDAKTLHWHIDHLLAELDVSEVWWTDDDTKWEETWAEALRRMPDARVPLRRFGSGDCRCEGHLMHLPVRPGLRLFDARIRALDTGYSVYSAGALELLSE